MEKINYIIEKLREKQIKVTPQRIAILKYLDKTDKHPSVEDIYEHVIKDYPTISLATVYNTLDKLVELNEIIKLKIGDENKVNYEYNLVPHQHFYCKECKKIMDIAILDNSLDMKKLNGFQMDEIHIYIKGICKSCLRNPPISE